MRTSLRLQIAGILGQGMLGSLFLTVRYRRTGAEHFERLRADSHTGHIPFMFITADARAGVREQCLALGADAFLLSDVTHAVL